MMGIYPVSTSKSGIHYYIHPKFNKITIHLDTDYWQAGKIDDNFSIFRKKTQFIENIKY